MKKNKEIQLHDTVICEGCETKVLTETARMDDEDGNWFCVKCVINYDDWERQKKQIIKTKTEYGNT